MLRSVCVYLLICLLGNSALAAEFYGAWQADWQFINDDKSVLGSACILQQRVGDYGHARFIGAFGEPLLFEIVGHRDLLAAGNVNVQKVAPPWLPDYPSVEPLGELAHIPGFSLTVGDTQATHLLLSLYDGFDAHLADASMYANTETVLLAVHGAHIRPKYEQFQRCYRGERANGWADLQRTRMHFAVDKHGLRAAEMQRLKDIAAYIKADAGINGVFIDGHTDNTGDDTRNYPLSQRRAEAVASKLKTLGVDPDLLTLRFHADRYPVASNDTDTGRARNRRTTVRLERGADKIAQR